MLEYIRDIVFNVSERLDWLNGIFLDDIPAWLAGWACGMALGLPAYWLGKRTGTRDQAVKWRAKVQRARQNLRPITMEEEYRVLCGSEESGE